MTNKEILQKAIEKATSNGYINPLKDYDYKVSYPHVIFSHAFAKAFWGEEKWEDKVKISTDNLDMRCEYSFPEFKKQFGDFLFRHLSDKMYYWTTNDCYINNRIKYDYGFYITKVKVAENWKYHIQKIVLEKEPLKYLEKFLNAESSRRR